MKTKCDEVYKTPNATFGPYDSQKMAIVLTLASEGVDDDSKQCCSEGKSLWHRCHSNFKTPSSLSHLKMISQIGNTAFHFVEFEIVRTF